MLLRLKRILNSTIKWLKELRNAIEQNKGTVSISLMGIVQLTGLWVCRNNLG